MKKYAYNLFPKPMVIVGYLLILSSIAYILVSALILKNGNQLNFPAPIAFMIIGLIMVSFKSKIIVDASFHFILKESTLFSMTLSKEKIRISSDCDRIVIKEKNKEGTGYYRFVLPVNYSFKSYDIFLVCESGVTRLINTDYSRSIKIAEFLKTNFNIEYILK